MSRLEELLKCKRMDYGYPVDGNLLHGLYDLVCDNITKDSTIVEIGSYSGISSELFALFCNKLYCVDIWEGFSAPAEKTFDELIIKYNNIVKIKLNSSNAAKIFQNHFIDLVYIDAEHSYHATKNYILSWMPKIKPNGIISGHDYYWPGVNQVVNEIFSNKQIKIYKDDSWLVKLNSD
jgi:predicted O-methyltransferase YrrM